MMKTTALLIVFSLFVHIASSPKVRATDDKPDPAGHWEGAIVLPTAPLGVSVDLERGKDLSWQGAIDIPAQGLRGFRLNSVKADGGTITFGLPGVPGDPLFAGRLSNDAKIISGDFTQGGQKFSFRLDRRAPPAAAAPVVSGVAGKGIEGRWQGTLKPTPGIELRLALEIARAESGETKGVLISIDQGNGRIPCTAFSEHKGAVHFETASIGGVFDGKLNREGSEFVGDWKQGSRGTSLAFKRLAPASQPNAASTPKDAAPHGDAASSMQLKWLVLSPIPVLPAGSSAQPDEAAQKKAFAADLLDTQGGEAQVRPRLGKKFSINEVECEWKAVEPVDNMIALNSTDGSSDFKIAYASTDFEVPSDTQAWLGIGSDDGVRVWLNGVLVHEQWIARPVQVDEDVVSVGLKAGKNRLLVKVQNITGSWGFACRLMDAEARAGRLVLAARNDDLVVLKDLVERGFEVNGRTKEGLTPFLAARVWGQKNAAEFLTKNGADTQATPPAPETLVDTLLAGRIGKDGAAAAVLVARNGKIIYEKAYGLADIERHLPATKETKFRIGSITKQFTASAILRLQEAGKLNITDTLSKYYPDFPRGGEVTLQRLLTHTSGIHSYTESPGFMENFTKPTSTTEVIASIKTFPFDFNPGERWSYCNSGFMILGDIVKKVSGKEYDDFLRETFFTPLGMTSTGEYRNDQPPSGEAVGYQYQDGQFKKALNWDMTWAGGAGSLYSTVEDLYRWNEAVFEGKTLSKDDLAAALEPVTTEENKNEKSDDGYGYGWMISHFRGAREIAHGGGLHGFLSFLLRLPERDFTVVVLVNNSSPKPRTDPTALSHEITEIYLGSELAPRPVAAKPLTKPVSSDALAAIVGRYDYRMAVLVVTTEGGRVYAQLGGQPKLEIFPKSDTEFFWKAVDAQVTFVKDATGMVVRAIHHQGGQTIHAPRLEEVVGVSLDDAQTNPLLGDYEFKAAGKMTISRAAGHLYAQLTGQPKLEISARSETEFFVKLVNAQLAFVKGTDGKVTKIIFHQGGQNYEMPKLNQP